MTQHNEIWVPEGEVMFMKNLLASEPNLIKGKFSKQYNVIVCTIDDLKSIWEAGKRAEVLKYHRDARYVEFKDYMAHKEIYL